MSVLPPPTIDPAAAYPDVAQARQAVVAGDWQTVKSIAATLDWAGRSVLHRAVSEASTEGPLHTVHNDDPTDDLAATLLAARLVSIGWGIRTSTWGRNVTAEQHASFHDYLCRAERILIDVIARVPDAVTAWEQRVTTARGLELGLSEARRRFDRLVMVDPHNVRGQRQFLQNLCPKWSGGTFEQVHSFARECMLAAPEGAHNALLVLDYHMERWLTLPAGEDAAHFRQPAVQAEVREAAQRSVWHADYRRSHGWVALENAFAAVFGLMGDQKAAAWSFTGLGPYADDAPWSYFGDPIEAFQRNRTKAVGAAR